MSKSNHYISGVELWKEMKYCNQQGELTDKAVDMFIKLSKHLIENKNYFNFYSDDDKEDGIQGGILDAYRYWQNFLPYNKNLIKKLIELELWKFNYYELCSKGNCPSKSMAPKRLFVNSNEIDNSLTELWRYDNKNTNEVRYYNNFYDIDWYVEDVYPLIVWSNEQENVRKQLYENDNIQVISEIPDDIKSEFNTVTSIKSNAFAYFSQVIKFGITKQWKTIYNIRSNKKISLSTEDDYTLQI
jgi:hypothetical protein